MSKGERTITFKCSWCGKEHTQTAGNYNRRLGKTHFCSQSCSSQAYHEESNKIKALKLAKMVECACGCGELIHKYMPRSIAGGIYEVRFKNGHQGRIPNSGQFQVGDKVWSEGTGVQTYCKDCGVILPNRYATRCRECFHEYQKSDMFHPHNYIEGNSHDYSKTFTRKLRRDIRTRDGDKCYLCGGTHTTRALDVHHIDYDKDNSNKGNLIALCIHCHIQTNGNRLYWRYKLTNLMIDKGLVCRHA